MARRSIKISIEPSIMKYGRYCSGLKIPDAAKKIGLSAEKLGSLEINEAEISLAQVERISAAYKMPLAYFFLKKKPEDAVIPEGFRIVYASDKDALSPKVMLAVRRARYVQSVIQELSDHKVQYDFKTISIDGNADEAASYFRPLLKTSIDDQAKWFSPSTALRNWKDSIEALGVFVLQQSIPKDDVSAFCLVDQVPYVICLNSFEHENRRIFSLFHEIGHILLQQSGVCTPADLSRNSYQYVRIEKFCNQFAASVLVPPKAFIEDPIVTKLRNLPFENWDLEDVKTLSGHFRVSQEVIYRKLVSVGILQEEQYEQKRRELIKGFEEYKKRKKPAKLIIPQFRKIISANGTAYSLFVLDNLHSKRITFADAADYLDTNTRHIAKVEEHIK